MRIRFHLQSPRCERRSRARTAARGLPLAVVAFAVLWLGTGCSGIFQNIGARWVTNQISDVFDMDEGQETATRAAVERAMREAPQVLGSRLDTLVATVDVALSKGLNEDNMRVIERQVDVLLDKVAAWIIDEAAPILATLTDAQIAHAERKLDERLQETRDELALPPAERLEDRQGKFVEAIESWTGTLRDRQESSLRAFVARMPDEAADRLRADEGRLAAIANGLRQHPGPPGVRDLLWSAWKERENWGPGTRSPAERRADGRKTLRFVYDLLDERQKDRVSERLHEIHERIKRLLGVAAGG